MYAGRLTFLLAALLAALLHTGDAACLTDWTSYKGNCYIFGQQRLTWVDGVSLCQAYNGSLVEIRSRSENDWILNEVKNRKMGDIWVGSSDIFREGQWNWITDRKSIGTVADWSPGQPDNDKGVEHCLEIRGAFGYKWNDWICEERNNVICKTKELLGRFSGFTDE